MDMKTILITISMVSLLFAPQVGFSQVDASAIVTRLQNADTSDDAVKEIESGNSELKSAIADKLPSLMSNEKNYDVLRNESKLAGDLKVIACIPILFSIFVNGDAIPMGTTSAMRWHMVDDPAGHALAQIGDPVIPDMKKLLTSNQSDNRVKAIRVLGNINSQDALDALKQHRSSESDKRLQQMIDDVASRN
jgi:HEAT repeat protein